MFRAVIFLSSIMFPNHIVVAVLGVSEDISSDWEVQVLSGVFWGFVYRGTSEVRIVIGSISGFLMI